LFKKKEALEKAAIIRQQIILENDLHLNNQLKKQIRIISLSTVAVLLSDIFSF